MTAPILPFTSRTLANTTVAGSPMAGASVSNISLSATALAGAAPLTVLSSGDSAAIQGELAARPVAPQDFAATFASVRQQSAANAATFSLAYAETLQTNDQAGQFFEDVALAPPADRLMILNAQKSAGHAESIVHGIALVPAAHGRVLMKDFLYPNGDALDTQAMGAVMEWIAAAGGAVRKRGLVIPDGNAPTDGIFDDIVDG